MILKLFEITEQDFHWIKCNDVQRGCIDDASSIARIQALRFVDRKLLGFICSRLYAHSAWITGVEINGGSDPISSETQENAANPAQC